MQFVFEYILIVLFFLVWSIRCADLHSQPYKTLSGRRAEVSTSTYAHADTINVKVGEKVKMGDKLATVGNTGDSTGAHLHFEVQRQKSPIDPGSALKKYGYESK